MLYIIFMYGWEFVLIHRMLQRHTGNSLKLLLSIDLLKWLFWVHYFLLTWKRIDVNPKWITIKSYTKQLYTFIDNLLEFLPWYLTWNGFRAFIHLPCQTIVLLLYRYRLRQSENCLVVTFGKGEWKGGGGRKSLKRRWEKWSSPFSFSFPKCIKSKQDNMSRLHT